MLLITDALSWDIEGTIAAGARAGQRVFSIGIGSAPGESMLRGLASQTGGGCELVSAGEDVEAAILRTFRRLRQPRVHGVALRWPAQPKWELPLQGAIFAGDTAYLAAAFAQQPAGTLSLHYRAGDDGAGRAAQIGLDWALTPDDTLARMLAHARLPYLEEHERETHALRYQLVTEATSLFVVHVREDKASSMPELQKIAQMHAHGVGGVGASVPQVVAFASTSGPVVRRRTQTPASAPPDMAEPPAFLRHAMDAVHSHLPLPALETDAIVSALRHVSSKEELADAVRRLAAARHGRRIDRAIAALRRVLAGDKELAWCVLLDWLARNEGQSPVVSPEVIALLGERAGGLTDEPEVQAILQSM